MYCSNCGSKVDENAYVCVNCGVIIKRNTIPVSMPRKVKKNNMVIIGILSIVFAIISLFFCLAGFIFGDISSVGMYVHVIDRIFFAIGYNFVQILFGTISLVLSLINTKDKYSKFGLTLTLIAFFLIITEFVVIIIY